MSGYCKQCSLKSLSYNREDFANLGHHSHLPNFTGWPVTCAKCGPTLVDYAGRCISTSCPLHGKENKKLEAKGKLIKWRKDRSV